MTTEGRVERWTPPTIGIERCTCGRCHDLWLTGIGKFVQGSGFTEEEAAFLKAAPALYEALEHAYAIVLAAAARMERLGQDEAARALNAEASDMNQALSLARGEGGENV